MKKLLTILILIITFTLCACGETSPPPAPAPEVVFTLSTQSLDMLKTQEEQVTATLTVDGVETSDATFSFTLDENSLSGVVELTQNANSVTVKALKFGSVKINCTATYDGKDYSDILSVSAVDERVEIDDTIYIEYAEDDQFTVPSSISGYITDVKYNGESIYLMYNRNQKKVAVNAVNLSLGALEHKLLVYVGGKEYRTNAEYIGMIVSNADEFFAIQDIAYELGDKDETAPTLAGNFYLDSDIVIPSTYTYQMKYYAADWEGGFIGLLDGRGHKVDGLTMGDNQMLFHAILGNGGIRNIAFVNSQKQGNGGFICYMRDSELTNVYLHFKKVTAGGATYLIQKENHGISKSAKNVMVVVDDVVDGTGVGSGRFSMGTIRWQCLRPTQPEYCRALDCVFVCKNDFDGVTVSGLSTYPYPEDQHLVYVLPLTNSLSDLNESQNDWDDNYWTVNNGIPSFKFN